MAIVEFDAIVSSNSVAAGHFDAFQPIYEENLHNNSESFSDTYDAYNNITITNNLTQDPFGNSNAAVVTIANSGSWAFVPGNTNYIYTAQVGEAVTYSIYIKWITGDTGYFTIYAGDTRSQLGYTYTYNVASGGIVSFISTSGNGTCTVLNVGNGWYRLIMSHIRPNVGKTNAQNGINNSITDAFVFSKNSINTTTNSQLALFGRQINRGLFVRPYRKTTTSAIVPTRAEIRVNNAILGDIAPLSDNLVKYSSLRDSSDSGWVGTGSGYDMGIDYSVEDPFGYRGVRQIYIDQANNGPFRINRSTYNPGIDAQSASYNRDNYVGQIWIRLADNGTSISSGLIEINDITAKNFSTQPITNTWQLYQFTCNTIGKPYQFIDLQFSNTLAGRRLYVYGAQLQIGTAISNYVESGATKIYGISSSAKFI